MDPDTVLRVANDQAMQYPSVAVGHPFGPEYTVYKVRGRMFMMAYELRGTPSLKLKIDPLDGEVLRDAYAEITPGYHMNKLHWITVAGASTDAGVGKGAGASTTAGGTSDGVRLDAELLHDLVLESYCPAAAECTTGTGRATAAGRAASAPSPGRGAGGSVCIGRDRAAPFVDRPASGSGQDPSRNRPCRAPADAGSGRTGRRLRSEYRDPR